jgi:hypothetical protein
MSAKSGGVPADNIFSRIEAKLALMRQAAAAPQSWWKRAFNSAAHSSGRSGFNTALVDAFEETVAALRETIASHEIRLEDLERELRELGSLSATVRQLEERSIAAGTELKQLRQEQEEKVQHLLDEQRVCLRQLALKTSEDAVLAERARRAMELRLEEFARRIPEKPA